MNKGFIYESQEADFKIVAVIFDDDGLVVHGKAVETREEGEAFLRKALAELRDVESFAAPR
ncbi:hypothetical protein LMIY3S_05486 [Labrys miyagiensis]